MKLDRTTYELFIIDYLEGNLTPVQVSELLLFLEQNPDLKQEFEGVEQVYLVHDELEKQLDKSTLKKEEHLTITPKVEELLIAEVESDLTPLQAEELQRLLYLYPSVQHELHGYQLTKLPVEETLVFPNKRALKKWVITPWMYRVTAVAAMLVAGLFVYQVMVSNQTTLPKQELSFGAPVVKKPNQSKPKQQVKSSADKSTQSKSSTEVTYQPSSTRIESQQAVQQKFSCALITAQSTYSPSLTKPEFTPVSYQPSITVVTVGGTDGFVTAKDWVKQKVNEQTNEEVLVNNFNKATGAGVSLERDASSGKLISFEVSSLGLAFGK